MNKTRQAPDPLHCAICLSAASTMLSFDTPIDVEGIQICCGTMYSRFIGLKEGSMEKMKQGRLKLCLACLTLLNNCYLFQQQAVKSASMFLGMADSWEEFAAPGAPPNEGNDVEVCEEIIVETRNQEEESTDANNADSIDEALQIETFEYTIPDEIDNTDTACETNEEMDSKCSMSARLDEEGSPKEEYLNETDDTVIPAKGVQKCITTDESVEYISDQEEEEGEEMLAVSLSSEEESTPGSERNTESDGPPPARPVMVLGAAERAVPCEDCMRGMDTVDSFREHFRHSHCVTDPHTQERTCTVCKRKFKHNKSYTQHLCRHQAHKPHVCPICTQSFHYQHHLKKHVLVHSREKPYACDRCGKAFSCKETLKNHKAQHDPVAKYACDDCGLRTKTSKSLLLHRMTHHGLPARYFEAFACENCGKMLHSRSASSYHVRQQCGEKTFGHSAWFVHCSYCRERFENRALLEGHLRLKHTEEELQSALQQYRNRSSDYECDVCGMRFSQRVILRRHKLRHEGSKPFQCAHCQRRFTLKGTLKTHERTHTGEKPFRCNGCGEWFRSAGSRRSHRPRCKNSQE